MARLPPCLDWDEFINLIAHFSNHIYLAELHSLIIEILFTILLCMYCWWRWILSWFNLSQIQAPVSLAELLRISAVGFLKYFGNWVTSSLVKQHTSAVKLFTNSSDQAAYTWAEFATDSTLQMDLNSLLIMVDELIYLISSNLHYLLITFFSSHPKELCCC